MDPLSQQAARGGALLMLSALAAYLVSGHPVALLTPVMLVAVVELLCLTEGPWTQPLLRRLSVRSRRR